MTRINRVMSVVMLAAVATAACGSQQNSATEVAQGVDITLKSEPDPPKMGDNTFEAMVMSGGQPVTDTDVSVEFFMAAMPAMNMPEMKNRVALKHEGDGRYRGAGNVMMAGMWDATVMVMRDGKEIGSKKFPVTAK